MKKNVVKKVLALCFCGVLLAGCGGSSVSEDDFNRLQSGLEKNATIKSAHFDGDVFLEVAADGNDARIKLNATGDYIASEDPDVRVDMSVSANGVKLADQVHFYFTDKTLYLDYVGNQMKMPLAGLIEDALLDAPATDSNPTIETENIENIKSLEVSEESDGTHFTLTYKDAWFEEIIKTAMTEVEETSTEAEKAMVEKLITDVFKSLKITYVVNADGYASVIGATADMDFDPGAGQENIKMKLEMTFNLTNIDKVEKVEFPDLSEYPLYEGDVNALSGGFTDPDLAL